MSRGSAQPGRWRREVRTLGRSLGGSRRSHSLLPLWEEGLPRPTAARLGLSNPRRGSSILDPAQGAEKGSLERREAQSVELAKGVN